MATALQSLIHRIYPSHDAEKVIIAGLDYSGKTTLLYLLKLGEVVNAIPSIGFNVETVNLTTALGIDKHFNLDLWDAGSGCSTAGGMALLRMYLPYSKALIWVVDGSDTERVSKSLDTLDLILKENDNEPGFKENYFPVLVLANKADKPKSMSTDEIRLAFSKRLSGRLFSIYSTSLTSKPHVGLREAFSWLALALDIAKTTKKVSEVSGEPPARQKSPSQKLNLREPNVLAKKLGEWLQRTESDSSPEELIEQFNAYSLPSWDHYTHIRLAFVILAAHGRQKGKDLLFIGLASYIERNAQKQTNARGFHFTMTYFWIQIVHFAIQHLPEPIRPAIGADSYPTSEDFFRFLLVNPHVVDGGLWSEYYTKEMIMSAEAKAEMVLPDKKPLPSMAGRDAYRDFRSQGELGKVMILSPFELCSPVYTS
ncbi:ADP-ribosylation factor [Ephemerocybe angulata]|uniref:ADP-ribosylation factor n=1 Tax=Ephemerocybe angulata TaxID=980116 RepID=A0A8H6HDM1_9AGAR|nr:ADP-ribosylation factor [Tulosesus angulatus]